MLPKKPDAQTPLAAPLHASVDPATLADDHQLRSRYIKDLLHNRSGPGAQPHQHATIPKVIVQFWHDPAALPTDVNACIDSWRPLTRHGFTKLLFHDSTARDFIRANFPRRYTTAFARCYHPAMRCDYFRLCYILLNGGFYVDADEVFQQADCSHMFEDNNLKVQPLCYDTASNAMVPSELFVAQRQSSPNWIFYVNNNPLISPPHHPIMSIALERATHILLSGVDRPDIQSTTGPGNLSASLVRHAASSAIAGRHPGFTFLPTWEAVSTSPWDLSYRHDSRNWRLL